MMYRFCRKSKIDGERFFELSLESRNAAEVYAKDHEEELQAFAQPDTGNIYGIAAELNRDKTTALLYRHTRHGLIWIETPYC